jgi:uncharacterized repeat protein (TIGR04138 family)
VFQARPEEERLLAIQERDRRYAPEAYEFTRLAVSYASEVYFATGTHVTGPELLEAIRKFALDRYGRLTSTVFESWGVHRTDDFGEIVFNLVGAGLLSKTETDRKEDFHGVFDFGEAFASEPYWRETLGSGR